MTWVINKLPQNILLLYFTILFYSTSLHTSPETNTSATHTPETNTSAIGEEVPEFVRRRGKIARKLCKDQGLWSQRWYSRVIKWDRHLSQSRNTYSWSSRLRTFHGSDWLFLQRMSFIKAASNTVSVLAGRTGTRTFPGKVFARWHDGVNNALFHISSENLEKI